jgi:hypothetical protein
LISSQPELPNNIDNFDDNEEEEEDLPHLPVKSEETTYMC